MVAYKKPQQRKKESEGLRGEGGEIKHIDLRFERWQVVGLSELRWERPSWPIKNPNKGRKRAQG